jgi:hypothetical protein
MYLYHVFDYEMGDCEIFHRLECSPVNILLRLLFISL